MKPAVISLVLPLAGCATVGSELENLVDNPYYRATGDPEWHIEIGDDIALRLGHAHFEDVHPEYLVDATYRYPAVLARHRQGVRRWRSGGRWGILVEARPGPCTTPDGAILPDHVRVVHFKGEWQGCGEPWSGDNPQ